MTIPTLPVPDRDYSPLVGQIADRLASPHDLHGRRGDPPWWPQSLGVGALAVALLHIERARMELAPWQRAHDWLELAASGPVDVGPDSHLHYGAPALTFVLHTATDERPGHYDRALATLDHPVAAATRQRLDDAHTRIDRGRLPTLAEFDAIRGLAGLGALWLRRDPGGDLVRDVLTYLVRLAEPIQHRGETLPGWWTHLAPSGRMSGDFPDGHANNGVAHGIGGPLALLSLAARRGIRVSGHDTAIARICAWLDHWRRGSPPGAWWPYWITRAELRVGRTTRHSPGRPSWCYGTAGLARAQQLAGIALGDLERQHLAETALVDVVTHPALPGALHDASMCHGLAGLLHITARAADDAVSTALTAPLPALRRAVRRAARVTRTATSPSLPHGNVGLLEGPTGVALALHTATTSRRATSGWDACLLMS